MGKHILLVEDDRDIREILAELLEARGYRVTTAKHGADALTALEREVPDVVVLDLMMPVMDGWELRRRMLSEPRFAEVPVVVMSGAANLEQSAAGLRAASVLEKPVPLKAVLAALQPHAG